MSLENESSPKNSTNPPYFYPHLSTFIFNQVTITQNLPKIHNLPNYITKYNPHKTYNINPSIT